MSLEIPLLGSDTEVIEINYNELPEDVDEVIHILKTEKAALNLWVTLAVEYYRRGKREEFVKLLEVGRADANLNYPHSDEDQVLLIILFIIKKKYY